MKKAVLFLLLVLCFNITGCIGNSPSGVIKDFYQYIENGKINDAFDLISEEGKQLLSLGGGANFLARFTENMKKQGGIKSIEIINEQIHGDRATVQHIMKFGNGATDKNTEQLIKQHGKWKIVPSK